MHIINLAKTGGIMLNKHKRIHTNRHVVSFIKNKALFP